MDILLYYVNNITNQIYNNTKYCNLKYTLEIKNSNLLILCQQFLYNDSSF